jgi:phosphate transport system substrate-binding protein
MYKEPKDTARSAATLAFFKWALEEGDRDAADLHYVALPPRLVRQIKKYWAAEIKSPTTANVN